MELVAFGKSWQEESWWSNDRKDLVGAVGIEPTSPAFQTGAKTTSATPPLVAEVGIEPTTQGFSVPRSTVELQGRRTLQTPSLRGSQ